MKGREGGGEEEEKDRKRKLGGGKEKRERGALLLCHVSNFMSHTGKDEILIRTST